MGTKKHLAEVVQYDFNVTAPTLKSCLWSWHRRRFDEKRIYESAEI
jgi:hypothetical protein